MSPLMRIAGLGVVVIALTVGFGQSQEAKKDQYTGKKRGVPPGWEALKLTAEQREKVVAVGAAYNAKIAAPRKQIDDLTIRRRLAQVKLLTEEQKATLLKGVTGGAPPAQDK